MTNLRFGWTWDADARNWRLSTTDMGEGLVAGYDHMAGYYERQLIEEIERLRCLIQRVVEWEPAFPVESSLLDELEHAFHAEPQRTIVDSALRKIASPVEKSEKRFNLDQLHKMAIEQGVFESRIGNTLTVSAPIRVPREPPHCPTCDCHVPGDPE